MADILFKIASFIAAIGILVAIHEFGHFWVARKLGIKVLRFSIGFGKPLWKKTGKIDGTEYVIAAIPLGGYVKMLDEREGEVSEHELHRAFNRQSLAKRAAVVIAGPLFNFLFAIFAFWAVLVLGETGLRPFVGEIIEQTPASASNIQKGDEILSVNGVKTPTWGLVFYEFAAASVDAGNVTMDVKRKNQSRDTVQMSFSALGEFAELENPLLAIGLKPERPIVPAIIGEILKGEAAAHAGLQVGDKVIAVDGDPISDWVAWVRIIQKNPGKVLGLQVQRDGQLIKIELIPGTREVNGQKIGRIGARNQIVPGLMEKYQSTYELSPLEAIPKAIEKTADFSLLTLKVFGKMITGEASIKNLSGPITLADAAGRTASIGLVQFLKFLAIVSVSLGVLNLLPIPVLDGGHLVWYLYEFIFRHEPSDALVIIGQKIGMSLLLGVMLIAFYVDINRFFG